MGGFIDNEVVGSPKMALPYSHAAGYMACGRTDLIACADVRTDVMAQFGKLYRIPASHQYTDYRELIDKEHPEVLSIATQPEQRAEITIYAAEHGVKAIYAEKAMSASLGEAYAMVEALEQNGVFFNLGTNRRWSVAYDQMKALVDSGELGALKNVIIYNNGTLFNTGSHYIDLVMRLNSDQPAVWAQGNLRAKDDIFDGDILREDPVGEGLVYFANGVTGYLLVTPRGGDIEVICENGTLTAYNDGLEWHLRRREPIDPQGRTGFVDRALPRAAHRQQHPGPDRRFGTQPGHGRTIPGRTAHLSGQHRIDLCTDRIPPPGRGQNCSSRAGTQSYVVPNGTLIETKRVYYD